MRGAGRRAGGGVALALALFLPADARGQAASDVQRAVSAHALNPQATTHRDSDS